MQGMMTRHRYIDATTRELFGSGCGTFFDLDPYERMAVLTLCHRRALYHFPKANNVNRQCLRFAADCGLARITEGYQVEPDPWEALNVIPVALSEDAYRQVKPGRVFAWVHWGQYHLTRKAA
jgi:hypothetical protein